MLSNQLHTHDFPSVFELLAEQKLDSLLGPALHYVTTQLAWRYPRYLIRPLQFFDEFFFVLMVFIQGHYLKKYQGTFSERFYSLQRYSSTRKKWTLKDVIQSLMFVVVVPYLKTKLELYYEKIKEERLDVHDDLFESTGDETLTANLNLNPTFSSTFNLKIWFYKLYPYLYFIYEGNQFVFLLLYTLRKTKYFNLGLFLLKLQVRWVTQSDPPAIVTSTLPSSPSRITPILRIFKLIFSFPMDLLQTALPVSIFCFKLWTWFLQFHSLRSNASSGLSAWSYFLTSFQEQSSAIPPPPPFLAAHPQGQKPGPKGICSLCKKKICNPACLPTGYVFCYTCIHPWIQTHLKCPITLKAMSMNEIHKVYSSSK